MGTGMGQPLGAGKRADAQAEGFAGGGTWEFDPHARVSSLLLIVSLDRRDVWEGADCVRY